ncbi:hypothetical protein KFK09_014916 [Dendrobium nobile]|uniref:RNase H type-1 domain-containing protein n=1 Tax=Dendrobium nobile TaxID=94219 RepID=A0A8T3B589_DENNO|nr:hypothetical protein KFK09_014916 [Dendrobium nobile]
MLLIHYVQGNTLSNLSNYYMLRDIKYWISLITYNISHILREGNVVADPLAKLGCILPIFTEVYKDSLPNKIKGLATLDQLGLPYIRSN